MSTREAGGWGVQATIYGGKRSEKGRPQPGSSCPIGGWSRRLGGLVALSLTHGTMSFKPRATLPETAFTLPARYYTDQALFEREQDVFYRGMWIGVGAS